MRQTEFMSGCIQQPVANFSKMKVDYNINTIVAQEPVPAGTEWPVYMDAATSLGLKVVMKPTGLPGAVAKHAAFLAFQLPDEPDHWPHIGPGTPTDAMIEDSIAKYKAQYDSLKQFGPVMLNFAGPSLGSAVDTPSGNPIKLHHYVNGWFNAADILSMDAYITNTGRPLYLPRRTDANNKVLEESFVVKSIIGNPLDKMVATGKPSWACLECSYQNEKPDPARAPNPMELTAEAICAIIHGATGIWWFTFQMRNPFAWDTVSDANKTAMKSIATFGWKYSRYFLDGKRTYSLIDGTETAIWTLPNGNTLSVSLNLRTLSWKYGLDEKVVEVLVPKAGDRAEVDSRGQVSYWTPRSS